ncbi:LysR family transcriptional regulator [Allokutzneria sp. A3M-2-11 16]|uniref:LysR family transcriptional regulator n=1 Tax=Allokutzneria sp. A3M-2-11 16 TaxID=2962043 RepID=UPI0020B6F522|nr:LysR family transcriptional regulator [Allokutzneria sp. A3M-2-11 16]MCP3802437.1 LysR family transcriptional regulator [Allokutzneria sp. A3M-2-11 16]
MELDIRHLRVICAIADAGSVTKAATSLGLSQPSLTGQLQRIESLLGGKLFLRGPDGTVPTDLGTFVISRARAVLPAIDQLQADAIRRAGAQQDLRLLRYGAAPGPLMVGLLGRLRELLPDAEVTLRTESSSATLVDLVASGRLELAAMLEYPDHEVPPRQEVERRIVATEPSFALLSSTHPLAARPELALTDLAEESWVIPPPGDRFREYFAIACQQAGFRPRVSHETEASGARDLMMAGQAVAIGQATFRETPGVVVRPIIDVPMRVRHVLVWNRNGSLTRLAERLLAAARSAYQEAVDRSPDYQRWLAKHGPLPPV